MRICQQTYDLRSQSIASPWGEFGCHRCPPGCGHNTTHHGDPWFYASHPPYFAAVIPRNPKRFFFKSSPAETSEISQVPAETFVRSQWLTTMVAVPPSSGGISQVPLKVEPSKQWNLDGVVISQRNKQKNHINEWRNKKHTSPKITISWLGDHKPWIDPMLNQRGDRSIYSLQKWISSEFSGVINLHHKSNILYLEWLISIENPIDLSSNRCSIRS